MAEGRKYLLRAENAEEHQRWVEGLQAMVDEPATPPENVNRDVEVAKELARDQLIAQVE